MNEYINNNTEILKGTMKYKPSNDIPCVYFYC